MEKRLVPGKRIPGCIQNRMHAILLCLGKKLQQEIHLQQRFPAADSDSALVSPVCFIAQCLP